MHPSADDLCVRTATNTTTRTRITFVVVKRWMSLARGCV
jgi:hypothetical protein